MKKKTLTIAIALVLVVALAVGATWAYLTATAGPVTNTFTAGKAVAQGDLKLYEHLANQNTDGTYSLDKKANTVTSNTYTVMPGVNLPKDPTVEVTKAEGPYYLFVEVTKGDSFKGEKAPLSCTVDGSHWVALKIEGKEVYAYSTDGKTAAILKDELTATPVLATIGNTDNTITVADTDLTNVNCQLTFTAYACQAAGFADATAAFNACFGA